MISGVKCEWMVGEMSGKVLPREGVYVLLIRMNGVATLRHPVMGTLRLRRGYYAYVGRASKGLRERLRRHLGMKIKKRHWHIDYLLEIAPAVEIWVYPLSVGECDIARELVRRGGEREGLRGFGSSDCRCPGHLVYLGEGNPEMRLASGGFKVNIVKL